MDYSDYQKLSAVAGSSVAVVDNLAVAAGIEVVQILSAEAGSHFESGLLRLESGGLRVCVVEIAS